jgi:hypothetical protein
MNTNTTRINIHPEEQPAVKRICRLMDIHVRYRTVPGDEILVAEIYSRDKGTKKMMRRLINVEMENIKSQMPTLAF